jgi:trigger factor
MPEETQPNQPSQSAPQDAQAAAPATAEGGGATGQDNPQVTPETAATAEGDEAAKVELPKNQVTIEDAGKLKKKVTVAVRRERIDAKMNDMFGELSHTALVPGFRVGRAPRRLIEKRFGREVGQDVRNSLVGESLQSAIVDAKLNTLGEPELDLDKIELPDKGEMSYSFVIEVAPEFELPALESIEVKKPILEITDERVTEQLEQWRQSQAKFEPTTEGASAGDVVTADVRITGEGFAEHHHKDHVIRVAPGQVEGLPLVDLADALAGKKVGETANLTIKVPEAHPNEAWRGKDATVALTLGQVRRRILPEINEDFAKAAGYESLDQLRQQVRTSLEARLKGETQRAMRDQVCAYLLSHTQFELPEGVASRHATRLLQRRYVDLLQRGVPREKIDENLAQLQAAVEQQAQADLRLTFVLAKVADQYGIKVEEGEVNSRIAAMANEYNRRPEKMKQELEQDGTLGEVETSILEEKALDALLGKARVSEVTPEQLAAEQAALAEQAAQAEKVKKEEPAQQAPAPEQAQPQEQAAKPEEPAQAEVTAKPEEPAPAAETVEKSEEPAPAAEASEKPKRKAKKTHTEDQAQDKADETEKPKHKAKKPDKDTEKKHKE